MQLAYQLASSGFRDTSRVGGGNPELGVMMAQYNKTAILRSLSAYKNSLDEIIDLIQQDNWTALEAQFIQTQQARIGISRHILVDYLFSSINPVVLSGRFLSGMSSIW